MSPTLSSRPYLTLSNTVVSNTLRRQHQESLPLSKLAFPLISLGSPNGSVPSRNGLPTPPSDMTGIAYNTTPSNYGGNYYGIPVSQPGRVSNTVYLNTANKKTSVSTTQDDQAAPERQLPKKSSGTSIAPYLQIPSSINDSKGSLAEFAAKMTCLFWFEKATKLKAIEDSAAAIYSLLLEAIPSIGFQKWVATIFTTTQVSPNVILLALLFVYRLKKFNPGVRGKKGSEFRLMTIALMMGNKFLDDNTYTNKTWAEVSGISVQEIHIMEVEFLSNVRYNLFVSKEEWEQWHVKLGKFADYFDRGSSIPMENELIPTTPTLKISPSLIPTYVSNGQPLSPASKLPSPSATGHHLFPLENWSSASHHGYYPARSPPRQLPESEFLHSSRKRSWDGSVDAHPAKRVAVSSGYSTPVSSAVVNSVPVLPPVLTPVSVASSGSNSTPRLPRPNFQATTSAVLPGVPVEAPHPPLMAGRALSSAYNTPTTWSQQVPSTSSIAPASSAMYSGSVTLPDPVRRQSPFPVSSGTISPALSAYSVHPSQTHLSPSFFLTNRNSPYRPVRTVNTLLIPPPSASLHPSRSLPLEQMRYQPLSKVASERKTGVLPYVHLDAWPQMSQPGFPPGQEYSNLASEALRVPSRC